jgi:SAM-dependent methyltransferase
MKPIIRLDLEKALKSSSPVILELGSGIKETPGRIRIDKLDLPHTDIVADLEDGLAFLPDNSVDAVYSNSFLEHIDDLDGLMKEIWRVLKPTGKQVLFVPHFSNPYTHSDYTHKRSFGLYTFAYFSRDQEPFKRRVPSFYHDYGFTTEDITLVFASPWRGRGLIKRICQKVFNLNTWLKEFYEENLCYMMPCYGVQATLRPVKDQTLMARGEIQSPTDASRAG